MSMRNEIIEHLGSVANIPAFIGQIIAELQKSEVDITTVVELIEMDPSLTTSVLKLVNSSAFAAEHPISSMHEASVRLGSYNLMQMVIGSSMAKVMAADVPGYDLPSGELWRASISAAIFTDVITDVLQIKAPGHTFTAGLLRDVGKIVLGSYVKVDVEGILKYALENDVSFPEAEYAILGIDHAEVGAVLMRRWRLPEELCTPVRWHHRPEDATSEQLVTCIVHLADILTSMSGTGVGTDGLLYNVSPIVVDVLKLKLNDIEKMMCLGMAQIAQAGDMFENQG